MNGERIGVVDVGGGYRGIYAAGVLDYCLDHGIQFDVGVGVSAGSANLISYAAGQARRNRQFYAEYGLRKEYASLRNFITKRSFLDLDYVYSTLSNSDGENPLDYAAAMANPMRFLAVATEAKTGKPWYFGKEDLSQDNYSVLKASCAIPYICHPYPVRGRQYYDGALADPVPIQKAFSYGCQKVVLLLTLPEDQLRTPKKDEKLARRIRKKYPRSAAKLEQRADQYNRGVKLARKYAAQGKLLIVAPDDTCGVGTICRDGQAMLRLYEKGYADGAKIPVFFAE